MIENFSVERQQKFPILMAKDSKKNCFQNESHIEDYDLTLDNSLVILNKKIRILIIIFMLLIINFLIGELNT